MHSSKGTSADVQHTEKEVLTNSDNRSVQFLRIFKLQIATCIATAVEELTRFQFSTCGIAYL